MEASQVTTDDTCDDVSILLFIFTWPHEKFLN